MAKPSVPRHSKSARKPVTIELEPSAVSKPAKTTPAAEPVGFDPVAPRQEQFRPAESFVSATPQVAAQPATTTPEPNREYGRTQTSEGPATSASVTPPRRSSDQFGRLASGLVGALVALVGAAALQWVGLLPSPKADLSAVEQQIAALQKAPAQALDEGAQMALNGAVENAKQASEQVSTLSHDVVLIKQSVEALKQNGGSGQAENGALESRIAELETKLNSSQQQAGAVAGATERLNALEAKVNDTSGQTNMALAMAATSLKAALDRGYPFGAELDTYAAVAPASPDIESLRPLAAKGVPTTGTLAKQFGDVATKIIAASRGADPNASLLDRLWASAEGLVQVRPVGMVEGEGVDAVTARIEAQLNAGDLGAAIAEWEKLPDNAKAISADFANAMKACQKADEVVSKALSNALTGVKAPAVSN